MPAGPSVLIVDQEPRSLQLLLEILARKGIVAKLAADRPGALKALDAHGCDLAFLSMSLAEAQRGDGLQLLREIRAASPEMPVIVMAAPAAEEVRVPKRDASRLGALSRAPLPATRVADHGSRITDHEPRAASDEPRRVTAPRGATSDEPAEALLHAGTQAAVRAMQAGCHDFLLKPLDGRAVDDLLERLLPQRRVATAAWAQEGGRPLYHIIGRSAKLLQTITLAEKIAPTSVPLLISGESGTGKELISLLVHHKSRRALGPFVRVNCAALSDSLLESELFGHEKGAFTGAYTQRKGRFEMAHGGTLLLDEITETPPPFQAKLLRIIEQQEFERVGGNENVKVNVRVISTTNRDLPHEVQMGRFRQDLYYRLSAARILLAPLRDRRDDLPELVWHFVNLYAKETQRRIAELDPAMLRVFANYDWPGNVRQLRNVVLNSLLLGAGPVLSLADVSWLCDELQPVAREPEQVTRGPSPVTRVTDHESRITGHGSWITDQEPRAPVHGATLEALERQAILATLRQTAGNQTKAAKVLGISDRTLREKMRRYRQQEDVAIAY